MLYTQTLTVPAATSQLDPAVETIQLTYGRLQYIWMHFPPGCRGTVSIALFHSLTQAAPATPGVGIALDDVLFGFPTDLAMDELPYQLLLVGWSPDSSFSHDITVHVALDVSTPAPVSQTPQSLLQRLAGMF